MNETPVLGNLSLLKPASVSRGCCNEGATDWVAEATGMYWLAVLEAGGLRSRWHGAVLSEGAGRSQACCFWLLGLQIVHDVSGLLRPSLRPLPSVSTQPSPCVSVCLFLSSKDTVIRARLLQGDLLLTDYICNCPFPNGIMFSGSRKDMDLGGVNPSTAPLLGQFPSCWLCVWNQCKSMAWGQSFLFCKLLSAWCPLENAGQEQAGRTGAYMKVRMWRG